MPDTAFNHRQHLPGSGGTRACPAVLLAQVQHGPKGTQQQCILRAQPGSLLVPGWPHAAASSSAQGREAAKRGTALAASWLAVPKMWVMTGPAAMLAGDGEGVFVEGRPRFTDIRGAAGQAEPRGTVSHSFYQGNWRKIFHPGRYSRISTSKSLPDVFEEKIHFRCSAQAGAQCPVFHRAAPRAVLAAGAPAQGKFIFTC